MITNKTTTTIPTPASIDHATAGSDGRRRPTSSFVIRTSHIPFTPHTGELCRQKCTFATGASRQNEAHLALPETGRQATNYVAKNVISRQKSRDISPRGTVPALNGDAKDDKRNTKDDNVRPCRPCRPSEEPPNARGLSPRT
jgi:hypothetical protein